MNIINILFFLTPKAEVTFLEEWLTLQQVLEKLEEHTFSSIPILNNEGGYVGTLSEGDLLWYFHHNKLLTKKKEQLLLTDVPRRFNYEPVSVNSNMEDLLSKIIQQNFVPVVDDCDKFIGIITRRDVIQYLREQK